MMPKNCAGVIGQENAFPEVITAVFVPGVS